MNFQFLQLFSIISIYNSSIMTICCSISAIY
nr:MAG TPA: hypothetical protein [Caudoviricetes sp.]